MHELRDLGRCNWDDFRIYLAVLRAGSLTRAAKGLGIEQSTVTRRIRALEHTLGHSLFERRYDGLKPTPLCHELAAYAERMEAAALGMLAAAKNQSHEPEGRVRIATSTSFAVHVVVPFVLAQLRAKYPRILLDLVLDDRVTDLARHEADIALRFTRPKQGGLIAKRLVVMPTAVLAHRDYPGAKRQKPDTLDWIVHALPGDASTTYLMHFTETQPKLTCTSHVAVVEAVRAGLGVGVFARSLCDLFPELVQVPVKMPLPEVELWLVASRAVREVPRVDAVWTFLEGQLADLVSGGGRPRTASGKPRRARGE